MLLVQPRRMAARAAARRLADLLQTRLGDRVGYHVRFDRKTSERTELIAMTTGVLLRRLGKDPLLSDVRCVLLDEFHERSLESDLALGMLQRVRQTFRPELQLIVMSATLDPQPIADFLGDATLVESEGRAFPVEIIHAKDVSSEPIQIQVASIMPEVLSASRGDVLVFLPGVAEIRRTHRSLEQQGVADRVDVVELYGDLPANQQDIVLRRSRQRRIILSTNVAETSLTIPGVTAVVDSGLARVMRYETGVGLPKLAIEPISRASAEQRAGRAGRTQPGVCYRLWPAAMHRSRRERELPEIQRADLSGAILMLADWGERDPFDFPWLSPPPVAAVEAATVLLQRLGALQADRQITPLGKEMLRFPMHPRLARFMVESARLGVSSDAALVAAMLTERDPFRSTGGSGSTHLLDRLTELKAWLRGTSNLDLDRQAANNLARVARQIGRLASSGDDESPAVDFDEVNDKSLSGDSIESLSRALLTAYPDRLARRRERGSDRGVLIGGRGVRFDGDVARHPSDLMLCVDVDSTGDRPEALVRAAVPIEERWIEPSRIRTVDEHVFDESSQSVVARRRRYVEDLCLSDVPVACLAGPHAAETLYQNAISRVEAILADPSNRAHEFLQRVRFLCRHMPELELPPLDEDAIGETLRELCQTRTSVKELTAAPWKDYLAARYSYEQQQQIDRQAPQRITVPSGNSFAVDYSDARPILSVRIQEIFGWKETPRVAGGKIPVQLHLLGPNHRPQQITEDLANFWKSTYTQVRKELRGRYPKHHWPEDPMNAVATRNGLKPRS